MRYLTDEQKKLIEDLARECVSDCFDKNALDLNEQSSFLNGVEFGFKCGANKILEVLREKGDGFNIPAVNQAKYSVQRETFTDSSYTAMNGFVEGAKWQHSQDQLQIAVLREEAQKDYEDMRKFQSKFMAADHRVRELEAEVARIKERESR